MIKQSLALGVILLSAPAFADPASQLVGKYTLVKDVLGGCPERLVLKPIKGGVEMVGSAEDSVPISTEENYDSGTDFEDGGSRESVKVSFGEGPLSVSMRYSYRYQALAYGEYARHDLEMKLSKRTGKLRLAQKSVVLADAEVSKIECEYQKN